jgi:hypothetical protein
MENDMHANDVWNFLKDTGGAHLVVGFLTTTGAVWKVEQAQNRPGGFSAIAPVSQLVGVPVPGLLDPSVGLTAHTEQRHSRQMHVAPEEISAVAYCKVRNSYSLDKSAAKIRQEDTESRPDKENEGKPHCLCSDEELDASDEEDALSGHDILVIEDDEIDEKNGS